MQFHHSPPWLSYLLAVTSVGNGMLIYEVHYLIHIIEVSKRNGQWMGNMLRLILYNWPIKEMHKQRRQTFSIKIWSNLRKVRHSVRIHDVYEQFITKWIMWWMILMHLELSCLYTSEPYNKVDESCILPSWFGQSILILSRWNISIYWKMLNHLIRLASWFMVLCWYLWTWWILFFFFFPLWNAA
jgi:hypothetical protein